MKKLSPTQQAALEKLSCYEYSSPKAVKVHLSTLIALLEKGYVTFINQEEEDSNHPLDGKIHPDDKYVFKKKVSDEDFLNACKNILGERMVMSLKGYKAHLVKVAVDHAFVWQVGSAEDHKILREVAKTL